MWFCVVVNVCQTRMKRQEQYDEQNVKQSFQQNPNAVCIVLCSASTDEIITYFCWFEMKYQFSHGLLSSIGFSVVPVSIFRSKLCVRNKCVFLFLLFIIITFFNFVKNSCHTAKDCDWRLLLGGKGNKIYYILESWKFDFDDLRRDMKLFD